MVNGQILNLFHFNKFINQGPDFRKIIDDHKIVTNSS